MTASLDSDPAGHLASDPTAGGAADSPPPAAPAGRQVEARGSWVVDLDGVIWLAGEPISGAAGAVARLRSAGVRVVFATNNAEPTEADLVSRLARAGIETIAADLITSAHGAATMLEPGSVVLAVGGAGLEEALGRRGLKLADPTATDVDAVVVGLTHHFDYDVLARAAQAVRRGARLIGTNDDPTHPTPDGLFPGSGALVAAVATAAQTPATFAGKPYPPMVDLVRARVPDASVMVGDRPATDGRLADHLGIPYALVRSGVLAPGDEPELTPDVDAADIGALVDAVMGA